MPASKVSPNGSRVQSESNADALARSAIKNCDPRGLEEAIAVSHGRLYVLDHPITFWDTGVLRGAGTLHAKAVRELFKVCHSKPEEAVGLGVQGAIANCRRLIEISAPIFLAAPGTGLEDDYMFAATKFVSMVWPERYAVELDALFREYVQGGFIGLEVPLGDEPRLVSHLLPLDAAIRVGNAHAAAAAVRAGARTDSVAMDDMGRGMDLLEYASQRAQFYSTQVVAALSGALMERAVLASQAAAVTLPSAAAARRRARV